MRFSLICPSCPFQNLSYDQNHTLFSNFARFCTPKRCTRVHCLVLKNNPNYVNFFTRMISNFKYKWPPRDIKLIPLGASTLKYKKSASPCDYTRVTNSNNNGLLAIFFFVYKFVKYEVENDKIKPM